MVSKYQTLSPWKLVQTLSVSEIYEEVSRKFGPIPRSEVIRVIIQHIADGKFSTVQGVVDCFDVEYYELPAPGEFANPAAVTKLYEKLFVHDLARIEDIVNALVAGAKDIDSKFCTATEIYFAFTRMAEWQWDVDSSESLIRKQRAFNKLFSRGRVSERMQLHLAKKYSNNDPIFAILSRVPDFAQACAQVIIDSVSPPTADV